MLEKPFRERLAKGQLQAINITKETDLSANVHEVATKLSFTKESINLAIRLRTNLDGE